MNVIEANPTAAEPMAAALILVPVTDAVLLPGMAIPLVIGRPTAATALQEAARTERHVVVALQREPFVETPNLDELYLIGTEARLLRYFTGRDGTHHAILQGIGRVRLEDMPIGVAHPTVSVARIAEPLDRNAEIEARFHQMRERGAEILGLIEHAPPELTASLHAIDQPGALADFITALLDLAPVDKQEVLETIDLLPRLDLVIARLAYRYEVLKLSHNIGQQTKASMEGRQREFMLREQLKAIEKELGDAGDTAPELDDLKKALAEAGLPAEVEKQAGREMRRLERMQEGAGEAGMVRSYLETLAELPWRLEARPPIDIAEARRVLDEDHFGLEKIKRRILEFLSVRKLNPDGTGPILCFVGPPGVGKTSLGACCRIRFRNAIRLAQAAVCN